MKPSIFCSASVASNSRLLPKLKEYKAAGAQLFLISDQSAKRFGPSTFDSVLTSTDFGSPAEFNFWPDILDRLEGQFAMTMESIIFIDENRACLINARNKETGVICIDANNSSDTILNSIDQAYRQVCALK